MKMTKNRQIILDLLRDPPDGNDYPAMSAGNLYFWLKDSDTPIHRKAIHRTLKEFWHEGLVVAHRMKTHPSVGILPRWELQFELSEDAIANYRRYRINTLEGFIRRRTAGVNFFGKPLIDDWKPGDREHISRELESLMFGGTDDLGGLMAWEAREQIVTVGGNVIGLRKIIQANHPDKPGGNPELARLAIEALDRLRAA
jgi:hypothetical protein